MAMLCSTTHAPHYLAIAPLSAPFNFDRLMDEPSLISTVAFESFGEMKPFVIKDEVEQQTKNKSRKLWRFVGSLACGCAGHRNGSKASRGTTHGEIDVASRDENDVSRRDNNERAFDAPRILV